MCTKKTVASSIHLRVDQDREAMITEGELAFLILAGCYPKNHARMEQYGDLPRVSSNPMSVLSHQKPSKIPGMEMLWDIL